MIKFTPMQLDILSELIYEKLEELDNFDDATEEQIASLEDLQEIIENEKLD